MSLLSDVEALKKSPLPEVRETIAKKVSEYFNAQIFEDEEQNIACDIIRIMAKDVEVRVRRALSEALKSNPNLPHDVALRLANDEVEVSVPVLEFSKVLTEGDLIEIIRSTDQIAKLIAISKRDDVSDPMSAALIRKRDDEVVVNLFSNKNAVISEENLIFAVDEFAKNGNVITSLIDRGGLPIGVVEKMIMLTSDKLKDKIQKKYHISAQESADLATAVREKATLGLIYDEKEITSKDLEKVSAKEDKITVKAEHLAKHLHTEKRLTSSIVLRSICEGNFPFFESSLSILSGVPLVNVRALVRSGDKNALKSLFTRAKFPVSVTEAISVIIEYAKKDNNNFLQFSGSEKQKLIEYISENNYDKSIPLMPYVMVLIGSNIQLKNIAN